MKKIYVIALLAFCIIKSIDSLAEKKISIQDSLALVDLYNSTDGPHWIKHTRWLTKEPVSKWYGITVQDYPFDTVKRVREIGLSYNNLNGIIPASIGNLFYLQELLLNNNHLSGSIPSAIDSLQNLNDLWLRFNDLTGILPSNWSGLKKLSTMLLDNNQITGNIPPDLGSLTKLGILDLNNNQLNGTIPPELANCPALGEIDLQYNNLNGAIPFTIGNLTTLTELDLSNNQLTGSIPNEICKQRSLHYLNLSNNQLSGSIPNLFTVNSALDHLYLNQNNLTGSIPKSIGNLKVLQFLSLAHNGFTGTIPDTLKNCIRLVKLQFADNELRGTLPSFLKSLPNLDSLNIENDHFTFAGMEPLVQHNFNSFLYDNQKKITIHQSGNTLYVNVGGTLSNNTYKWYKDGSLVATIIGDSTYIPAASGNYTVSITNSVCTALTLQTGKFSFTSPQAKQENATASSVNQFSIYPNPAHDFINVYCSNAAANATIIVYDLNGNKLTSQAGTGNSNYINITPLAAGSYFVELKTNSAVVKQKFVKE